MTTPFPDTPVYRDIVAWFTGLHHHILATPAFASLRPLFPVAPEDLSNLMLSHNMHHRAMTTIDRALSTADQSLMIAAIDDFLRRRMFLPSVAGDRDFDSDSAAADLTRRGHVPMPPITSRQVTDMRDYFADKPVRAGMANSGDILDGVDRARPESNFARFPTPIVLGCSHLMDIACDPRIIAAVERHLGALPTIAGISAWWSFADVAEPDEAQRFHCDTEDYRFCKMFIYLTDVDEDGGPHLFIEGTHDRDTIGAIRRRWPDGEVAFDSWYFDRFWKSDEDTHRAFDREPVVFTGTAGDCFIVNTRGLHKGRIPVTSDRLLCQILYGVLPRVLESLAPVTMGTPEAAHVTAPVVERPFDYVSRLYVSAA